MKSKYNFTKKVCYEHIWCMRKQLGNADTVYRYIVSFGSGFVYECDYTHTDTVSLQAVRKSMYVSR